jgi:hypothetical protein
VAGEPVIDQVEKTAFFCDFSLGLSTALNEVQPGCVQRISIHFPDEENQLRVYTI